MKNEYKKDNVLYNNLMEGCIKFKEYNKGLELYELMKKNEV